MRTLLRLDASAHGAQSHSRQLADRYEHRWREAFPDGEVLVRDLVSKPLQHLDDATIVALYSGGELGDGAPPPGIALSDQLISELMWADDVLVSSAVYNFSMPSALKAWVDLVVRFGHTVARGEGGPMGLVKNKRACFITARGGNAGVSPDYQRPTLHAVFSYIGIEAIDEVHLEGTSIPDGKLNARVSEAQLAVDQLFEG